MAISFSQKAVLVVEDDEAIRSDLAMLLESSGYAVEQAENGDIAIKLLQSKNELPRLVILDIMMPVMDGWQFRAAQVQDSRLASIPVVVMTADGHAKQKAAKMQAQGYVQKPIDIDLFLGEVAKFVP
jgi:CheY-like chemotaxis protein